MSYFPKNKWHWIIVIYLFSLICSHIYRIIKPYSPKIPSTYKTVNLPQIKSDRVLKDSVQLAYQDLNADGKLPTIVLIHGSPTGLGFGGFENLGPELAKGYRVIIPDLPGFVMSRYSVPDYSVRAHAHYLNMLMQNLNISKAHFVGYSMGSGVVINLHDINPDLVKSIDLLAGIAAQELELFGNYYLNHAVHGVQLLAIKLFEEGIPHFGFFDDIILSSHYARNFYDTDQRPLSNLLKKVTIPLLIQHGKYDNLVSYEVALENERIVPQSKLITYPFDHSMPFRQWKILADDISKFIGDVETGSAIKKESANPVRIENSQKKIVLRVPDFQGATLIVMFLLIVVATFISEDLTSIATGIAIANGTLGFIFGVTACFIGIYIGDLLLYIIGRVFGKAALDKAPLKWWLDKEKVLSSQQWFSEKGAVIIFLSRFIPGTRLPTYVGAGMFGANFWFFSFWFLIASFIWTPLLVSISMLIGEQLFSWFDSYSEYAIWFTIGIVIFLYIILNIIKPLFSYKGRRLLLGKYRRLVNWEFWPMWAFYPPLVLYVFYLGLRFRSFTLFTLANPSIAEGGFVGESKSKILEGLNSDDIARFQLVKNVLSNTEKNNLTLDFMKKKNLGFPIILKPNYGERGEAVQIIKDKTELEKSINKFKTDFIIQEYIKGIEFGVFYIRKPDESDGFIFSVTDKQFTSVNGDGKLNLEHLILNDDRAICSAKHFLSKHYKKLKYIPKKGEKIRLVEIGTHSKGALFLDAAHLITPELTRKIDQISKGFNGFYFGRYDIRVPSIDALQKGKSIKILELNGVTSEATHIYDPKNSYFYAYSILMKQWRYAFEIGDLNRLNGLKPEPLSKMIRLALFH